MRGTSVVLVSALSLLVGCSDDAGGAEGTSDTDAATSTSGGPGTTAGEDTGTGEGGGTGTDDGPSGAEPDEAIRSLVQARCGWMFDCCTGGELAFELGPFTQDAADCVDRVMAVLESGNPDAPISAGPSDLLLGLVNAYARETIELDPGAVMTCAEHLQTSGCNPVLDANAPPHCDPEQSVPIDDPCDLSVLATGKQEVGESCEPALAAECAPGARCVDFGTGGVCAALAAEGDPCFADTDCIDPLVCDLAGDGRCTVGGDLGDACSFVDPENPVPGTELDRCARDSSCDPVDLVCRGGSCGPGAPCAFDAQCPENHACVFDTCLPLQGGGGPCEVDEHCISNVCSSSDQCTTPQGQPDGAVCFIHSQCVSGFCDFESGACAPPKASGQPCETQQDEECDNGFCDNTDPLAPVCVGYAGDGDPCVDQSHCDPDLGLSCMDGTCRKLDLGEPCLGNDFCTSGLCHAGLCETPTPVGSSCGGTVEIPCADDAFCDIPMGLEEGTCRDLKLTGSSCNDDTQCWGSCVEAWSTQMCDDTPAEGTTWCDGQ